MKTPYHAFIDADDIDYGDYSQNGQRLPVIVIAEFQDPVDDMHVVHLIAPDGEKYVAPAGLLYTMTLRPIAIR